MPQLELLASLNSFDELSDIDPDSMALAKNYETSNRPRLQYFIWSNDTLNSSPNKTFFLYSY